MRFFSDRHDRYFPISTVVSVFPPLEKDRTDPRDGRGCYRVTLKGGAEVLVPAYSIDEVIASPTTMIPAQPGTYLLGGVEAEDEDVAAVWQTPVIAWRIGAADEVKPWTPDGPDDSCAYPCAILMPNGIVIEQQDRSYRTLEEWFTVARDAKRAEQAKAGLGPRDEDAAGAPRSDAPAPSLA